MDIRRGNQSPTASVTLPYTDTHGDKATELYNSTGRTAQEWQEALLYDILAVNPDGLYTHMRYGYSVPRRNGKNEIVIMRELYGLVSGEVILHTAHRTTTSHSAWERLGQALAAAGFVEDKDYKSVKQFGLERYEMANGGRISFRTRSSKGGLGEGFDLLVIDEAQEYTVDQETALKYVVADSKNPQTLYCGTPPTAVSVGTVFKDFRAACLAGKVNNAGWAEWGVESLTDPSDKEAWYLTNPSLGTVLTERKIEAEIGDDKIDFNIQRLGLWLKYNQQSAISQTEWDSLKVDKKPKFTGKLHVGIKYGHDGMNVSTAVAVRTADGRIFVEVLNCAPIRDGNAWILRLLSNADIAQVTADGAPAELLAREIKQNRIPVKLITLSGKEYLLANSQFEQAIEQKTVCHNGQPSLRYVVSNCEKRFSGSAGGFAYKSQKMELDISLLDAVILAYHSCANYKATHKQKVYY